MSIQPPPSPVELGESTVEEVRAIREALDAAAGHDVRRLAEMHRQAAERVRQEFGLSNSITPQDDSGSRALPAD